MKNGSAWRVVGVGMALLVAMVSYIIGGWRSDMERAQGERDKLTLRTQDQGERIAVLESRYEGIAEDLKEIKDILKERK